MNKDFESVIRHNFEANLMALKDVQPNSFEFDYIWDCLNAYKVYKSQKKYYLGFGYGQSNKEN